MIIFSGTASDEKPPTITRQGQEEANNSAVPVLTVARMDGVLLWENYSSGSGFYVIMLPDQPQIAGQLELTIILLPACIVVVPFAVAVVLFAVSSTNTSAYRLSRG